MQKAMVLSLTNSHDEHEPWLICFTSLCQAGSDSEILLNLGQSFALANYTGLPGYLKCVGYRFSLLLHCLICTPNYCSRLDCIRRWPQGFHYTLHDPTHVLRYPIQLGSSPRSSTLAFQPYKDITIDILGELQRIKQSIYSSDSNTRAYSISRTIKRLGDGHAGYNNYCCRDTYSNPSIVAANLIELDDSLFITYLPFPLAVLAQPGNEDIQNIHIVPEASEIVRKEFGGGALNIWHSALGRNLSDFDGARIVSIQGQDPWTTVDAYAAISGGYQSKTTRQNNFFSSYQIPGYRMGDFAQSALPIRGDSLSLTLVRNGSTSGETYNVPYLSRKEREIRNFTNASELWDNNCQAKVSTNGRSLVDRISVAQAKTTFTQGGGSPISREDPYSAPARFQSDPIIPRVHRGRRLAVSSLVNDGPQLDITLPEHLVPTGNVSGAGDMHWFVLEDGKTTNNGGGAICLASWLHRVLAGPEPGLDFQPGMNGSVRARELPRKIVNSITSDRTGLGALELIDSFYTPSEWKDVDNKTFPANYNWLEPGLDIQINGIADLFSQRIGDTCLPFHLDPPTTRPFEFENIAIMSNGRCASSCSLFSILMHTKYNVKTVVVGGKPGTTQQYCGVVGGQSSNFAQMDSELKTFGLKKEPLSPPDFLTNSFQGRPVLPPVYIPQSNVKAGITWRLAFSPADSSTFEEFKSHPAQYVTVLGLALNRSQSGFVASRTFHLYALLLVAPQMLAPIAVWRLMVHSHNFRIVFPSPSGVYIRLNGWCRIQACLQNTSHLIGQPLSVTPDDAGAAKGTKNHMVFHPRGLSLSSETPFRFPQDHTDVFLLKAFGQSTLVLNSAQAASELLDKRSAKYSDRNIGPMLSDPRLMDWSAGAATARYGDLWRHYRRMLNNWLNAREVVQFHNLQQHQARLLLRRLLKLSEHSKPFYQVRDEFFYAMASTMFRLAYGYHLQGHDDLWFQRARLAVYHASKAPLMTNFIVNVAPILAHIPDWFPGASWKRVAKEWRTNKQKALDEPYEWAKSQVVHLRIVRPSGPG
ncbi:cytochrome P450 domain-containing protein [Rhizoctonia solani AG-1 IA]|uniref:Cytochrome P450 domain-containing protein n=1 Tax=Thanatephorus cucumeris (strain AG1-IA) TaxID=983506 RepID=L8WEY1_THACA|nr:cytochrome P450 domain-containing protein [Rhizoctonia solani AG-1 IA]